MWLITDIILFQDCSDLHYHTLSLSISGIWMQFEMFLCVQCLSVVHFMGLMWELERCLGQASLWNWRYARPRCIGCLSTWCPFNAFWWRSVQSLCWAFYTFFYRLILFHMLVLNSHLWKMCFFLLLLFINVSWPCHDLTSAAHICECSSACPLGWGSVGDNSWDWSIH